MSNANHTLLELIHFRALAGQLFGPSPQHRLMLRHLLQAWLEILEDICEDLIYQRQLQLGYLDAQPGPHA